MPRPIWVASRISATVPPALARGDEPKRPARQRKTRTEPRFGEAHVTPCHRVRKAYEMR
jgi:hypothetical protein